MVSSLDSCRRTAKKEITNTPITVIVVGKFHMVEILLQSAEDEALSEVLHHEGQNIWHVIADFKPFNSEVWEEYVFDIIERISSLNLSISKDNSGRTPIHYAAKHGQTALLQRLLAMPNVEINVVDKDDNTELTYAVDSGNIEIVKVKNILGRTSL